MSEAQSFVDERLAITRKVRDATASAQDKQKQYADQNGRKINERFSVGDKVLLSTSTLPKHAVSVLPGGTTKLLPRFIGPYTVVEEVGDLNYRLSLSPYMKTHPVFYVGRLKRYVDPQEITYPHESNVRDRDVDHAMSHGATEGMVTESNSLQTNDPRLVVGLGSEVDSTLGAGPSAPSSPKYRSEASGGRNPAEISSVRRAKSRSVVKLDSRAPRSDFQRQRHAPAFEQSRVPRSSERSQRSCRSPPSLVDSEGNQRFLVGRLVARGLEKQKLHILV